MKTERIDWFQHLALFIRKYRTGMLLNYSTVIVIIEFNDYTIACFDS